MTTPLTQYEKKPDNPLFERQRREAEEYTRGLQEQVLQVAMRYPEKYIKHQAIGESYMNVSYEPVAGEDTEGDAIKARHLLYAVRDYCMEDSDLSREEILLLRRVYGENWKDEIEKLS